MYLTKNKKIFHFIFRSQKVSGYNYGGCNAYLWIFNIDLGKSLNLRIFAIFNSIFKIKWYKNYNVFYFFHFRAKRYPATLNGQCQGCTARVTRPFQLVIVQIRRSVLYILPKLTGVVVLEVTTIILWPLWGPQDPKQFHPGKSTISATT